MIMHRSAKRYSAKGALLAATAALLLAACGDRQTVLPGERFSIRPGSELAVTNTAQTINLGAPVLNADWPMGTFSASGAVPHLAFGQSPTLVWSADVGQTNTRRSRVTSGPVVAGGVIYVLDSTTTLRAHDAASGARLWSSSLAPITDIGGAGGFGGGLAVSGRTVFATTGFGQVVAVDMDTGGIRWRHDLRVPIRSAPTISDGRLLVMSQDGTAFALNLEGRALWRVQGPVPLGPQSITGASPVVSGGTVVMPFAAGRLGGASTTGAGRWQAEIGRATLSDVRASMAGLPGGPVISGGRVFVGNGGGQFAAVNLNSGTIAWSVPEGASGPAAVLGGSVFVLTDANRLLRLRQDNGAPVWAVQLPQWNNAARERGFIAHFGPVAAGGLLWLAGADGLLRGFDPASGAVVATAQVPGGAAAAPVVAGGVMYVLGANGRLHAYR